MWEKLLRIFLPILIENSKSQLICANKMFSHWQRRPFQIHKICHEIGNGLISQHEVSFNTRKPGKFLGFDALLKKSLWKKDKADQLPTTTGEFPLNFLMIYVTITLKTLKIIFERWRKNLKTPKLTNRLSTVRRCRFLLNLEIVFYRLRPSMWFFGSSSDRFL